MLARSGAGRGPSVPRKLPPTTTDTASRSEGAEIEVVAISTVPTGPQTWWKPDGSRLAEPPEHAIEPERQDAGAATGEIARVIPVRALGGGAGATCPVEPDRVRESYWGGRPRKDGKDVPGLDYYEATRSPATVPDAGIKARGSPPGPWKTEVSNDGRGGTGQVVNGHKFSFWQGLPPRGERATDDGLQVAHNFFGQDRRLVAIDRDGHENPAASDSYSVKGIGRRRALR